MSNHDDRRKTMKMKKYFAFLVASVALCGVCSFADYVAQDFISPRTGKSAVFWGDASKGSDAYVLEYDEASDHYYFKKVEKNKPAPKKTDSKSVHSAR